MKVADLGINCDEGLLLLCVFHNGLNQRGRNNTLHVVGNDHCVKIRKRFLDVFEKKDEALAFQLSAVFAVETHDLLIVGYYP